MQIAILTSSRADYSIYLPLLKKIKAHPFFSLTIIAFGTHLSASHGETINQIYKDGFKVPIKVDTMPKGDEPADISAAMGKTITNFSNVWKKHKFDLVVVLGDRYEMFAASASVVPFGMPIAHIHGGETTLGAIDDSFRHSITQMAGYHFVATELYKERVSEIKGSDKHVYNVGALSIDNLQSLELLGIDSFKEKFGIDMSIPSILVTFHPETVTFQKNEYHIQELIAAMKEIDNYQFIITMPNTDTMGNMIRTYLQKFVSESAHAVSVESFGTLGYLSCMKHCSMMLGNTSSGFIEASFFPKYVVNIGERQTGRIITKNIQNCKIEKKEILTAVKNFSSRKLPVLLPLYGNGNAAGKIVNNLISCFS